jgi:putative tryptophan/tyrosine transport system substrate-binding protein
MRSLEGTQNLDTADGGRTGGRELLFRYLYWLLVQASITLVVVLLPLVGPNSGNAQDRPLRIGVLALGPRYIPAWHCGETDYRLGSDEPKQDTEPYYVLGLLEELKKLNYIEDRPENAGKPGRRFALTFRTGTSEQLREFAREFVADRVDVIVAVATAAVRIAQEATREHPIPIVMTGVSDPVKYAFVQSLAHPGGYITGVSHQVVQGSGKRVELFKEMLPGLKRLLTIRQAGYPPSEKSIAETREAAGRLKIEIIDRTIESRKDIQDLMTSIGPDTVDGIMILPDSNVISNLDLVIEASLARRVPAFGVFDYMAAWGAVAADGPSAHEAGARVAAYIDRIVKDANPASLAVVPVEPKFTINLKAARCVGMKMPFEVLSQADQVIQ